MNRIVRIRCEFCQHENCEEFEEVLSSGKTNALDLEKEQGWKPNTVKKHLDHHAPGHHSQPNTQCNLCTSPHREEYEIKLRNGDIKTSELSEHLGMSIKGVQNHIHNHLKPAVQKSAALLIAQREVDEIGVLTDNVELIRNKIDELLHETDLSFKQIDALAKLAKEVRESLKYLLEFKGKLIHRREETIIVKQVEIIQRVLLDKYPDVWENIRSEIEEELQ